MKKLKLFLLCNFTFLFLTSCLYFQGDSLIDIHFSNSKIGILLFTDGENSHKNTTLHLIREESENLEKGKWGGPDYNYNQKINIHSSDDFFYYFNELDWGEINKIEDNPIMKISLNDKYKKPSIKIFIDKPKPGKYRVIIHNLEKNMKKARLVIGSEDMKDDNELEEEKTIILTFNEFYLVGDIVIDEANSFSFDKSHSQRFIPENWPDCIPMSNGGPEFSDEFCKGDGKNIWEY